MKGYKIKKKTEEFLLNIHLVIIHFQLTPSKLYHRRNDDGNLNNISRIVDNKTLTKFVRVALFINYFNLESIIGLSTIDIFVSKFDCIQFPNS
ncbi:hypothetical protein KUB3006_C04290 [Enterococcus faecalis]|nr:hypothetical protein KUB3006_C04290 [Enterococcus faecalis]BBD27045.1 hypothetical protein KUB3007_C04280 [Enterococcus faecalis]